MYSKWIVFDMPARLINEESSEVKQIIWMLYASILSAAT